MPKEQLREQDNTERIHVIGENEQDLIVTVRIRKDLLVANFSFITAMFELANLLSPLR